MSKKRKRDFDEASLSLVNVYNDLADEDVDVRKKAAAKFLAIFSDRTATNPEQISTALKRLLRGLCSGRKAARPGFAIVLVEFLSRVFHFEEADRGVNASQVIELLQQLTAPSESVSKQVCLLPKLLCQVLLTSY